MFIIIAISPSLQISYKVMIKPESTASVCFIVLNWLYLKCILISTFPKHSSTFLKTHCLPLLLSAQGFPAHKCKKIVPSTRYPWNCSSKTSETSAHFNTKGKATGAAHAGAFPEQTTTTAADCY